MSERPGVLFDKVDIYYNYVFDLGRSVDPADAAHQLLEASVGRAFCNPKTDKIEVSRRYTKGIEAYNSVNALRSDYERFSQHTSVLNALRLVRHRPGLFGQQLVAQLFRSFRPERSQETNDVAVDEQRSGLQSSEIDEAAESIRQRLVADTANLAILLRLHEFADQQAFSTAYLDRIPFVRVSLEPFHMELGTEKVDVDVEVGIHHSGIAIVTAYVVYSGSYSADDLVRLRRGDTPLDLCLAPTGIVKRYTEVRASEAPEILRPVLREYLRNIDREELAPIGGKEAPATLGHVLEAYSLSIVEAVLGKCYRTTDDWSADQRTRLWHIYPFIFAKQTTPPALSGTSFKAAHSGEIGRLLMDLPSDAPVKQEIVDQLVAEDLAVTDDHSFYVGEGISLAIYYANHRLHVPQNAEGNEWIHRKFALSVVVDLLLFQLELLEALNGSLNRVRHDSSELATLRAEYARALDELEWLDMSNYGSVSEAIRHGQVVLGINNQRALFHAKSGELETIARIVEADAQERRTRLAKRLAAVVTVLGALPLAIAVVSWIAAWPASQVKSWVAPVQTIYAWCQNSQVKTTLLLFALLAIISLAAILTDTLPTFGRTRIRSHRSRPSKRKPIVSPFNITNRPYKERDRPVGESPHQSEER